MSEPKKIAAVITEYRVPAHADVIVGKFIKGFPTDDGMIEPQVDIVSMYLDQIPESDIGIAVSEKRGIPIYRSIKEALCLGGEELAVDGVISIGEHGTYAVNEKGQHMHPRRYFFEQICGVMARSGRSVPVFSDKHLSYNFHDAKWMYDRARALGVPFMAGSSVPLFWRDPWLEHEIGTEIEEALGLGLGGLDSYGFHGFEALQDMVERRKGGESGIAAVQCLEGDAVWKAGDEGVWSRELAEAAFEKIVDKVEGSMEEACEKPAVMLIEYRDGFKAALLQIPTVIREWGYAARVGGQIRATAMNAVWENPHPMFSYLSLNIQEMFLTGKPQYPVERTLLVSGALEAIIDSSHQAGARIETPHLEVAYQPPAERPIRPLEPRPLPGSRVAFESPV